MAVKKVIDMLKQQSHDQMQYYYLFTTESKNMVLWARERFQLIFAGAEPIKCVYGPEAATDTDMGFVYTL